MPTSTRADRAHHVAVESRDTVGGAFRHVQFDISNSKRDSTEALIGLIAPDAISPRTNGLDEIFVLLEIEACPAKPFTSSFEALDQRLTIRHDDSGVTAHKLRRRRRQMELAAADVDPHVGRAGHQIRIAREAETGDVEDGRLLLVGDRYVDVFQRDDVAEVFGSAIELSLHDSLHPRVRPANLPGARKSRLQYFRREALWSAECFWDD
jgi:hypothetical protein